MPCVVYAVSERRVDMSWDIRLSQCKDPHVETTGCLNTPSQNLNTSRNQDMLKCTDTHHAVLEHVEIQCYIISLPQTILEPLMEEYEINDPIIQIARHLKLM